MNEGILNDFSACNTFISNDNMVACSSLNELISNRSGLPEVVQIREKNDNGVILPFAALYRLRVE